MSAMVQHHGVRADVRLERRTVIRQWGKKVLHLDRLLGEAHSRRAGKNWIVARCGSRNYRPAIIRPTLRGFCTAPYIRATKGPGVRSGCAAADQPAGREKLPGIRGRRPA